MNHLSKLNWLRAAVLGANDGIVSTAGLVLGVAGATSDKSVIFTAGLAGIIAGAISMAVGEYVSVSSSKDTEKVLLMKEKKEIEDDPIGELHELANIYEKKGLSKKTALIVAEELSAKDPLKAHFDAELGIDPHNLTNPWHAAFASAASFVVGAFIPFSAILIPPVNFQVYSTAISVMLALILTGMFSAQAGGANKARAMIRVVLGGIFAMLITFLIGKFFGTVTV